MRDFFRPLLKRHRQGGGNSTAGKSGGAYDSLICLTPRPVAIHNYRGVPQPVSLALEVQRLGCSSVTTGAAGTGLFFATGLMLTPPAGGSGGGVWAAVDEAAGSTKVVVYEPRTTTHLVEHGTSPSLADTYTHANINTNTTVVPPVGFGTLVARRIGLGARPLQIKFLDPSLADPGLKESLEKVSQRTNRAHYDGCITTERSATETSTRVRDCRS